MNISHVIRGEEWLPSAPLHVMLYRAFGWDTPQFAHLPLLLRPDGNGKLSKRDGDRLGFPVFPTDWTTADGELYSGYREKGYFPDAFINMLAFLGWNPGTNQELFSLDELVEAFSLERVSKSGAKFDPDKTKWFQQQYLRKKTNEELASLLKPLIQSNLTDVKLATMCSMMKERATFIKDIITEGNYLIERPSSYDEKVIQKKWKEGSASTMSSLRDRLEELEVFDGGSIENAFHLFLEESSLGLGAVLPLLRLLITGAGAGPSMFEIASFLGKEECIARMDIALKKLGE
jgi:glutamyl-tRNA synthetase